MVPKLSIARFKITKINFYLIIAETVFAGAWNERWGAWPGYQNLKGQLTYGTDLTFHFDCQIFFKAIVYGQENLLFGSSNISSQIAPPVSYEHENKKMKGNIKATKCSSYSSL